MEFTKKQAQDLKSFLASKLAMIELDDYATMLKVVDDNTMTDVEFDLDGEQTDDIKEVYAYMMRNGLTRLDDIKK